MVSYIKGEVRTRSKHCMALGRVLHQFPNYLAYSFKLVLSMTLNCGWEDLSSTVPSSARTGGNGGGFLQEKPPSLIRASGVSCVRSFSFSFIASSAVSL